MIYDLLIIGSGPAGLSAAIYAARARLKIMIIEQALPGGQINLTAEVENYPGFAEPLSGLALGQALTQHAQNLGIEITQATVTKVDLKHKQVFCQEKCYQSQFIIIATGSGPKSLDIPGESKFKGRGVSYCATCDGAFFQDKEVAVIGGGDSAVEEALFLARIVAKVYLIHRRPTLRAQAVLSERLSASQNINQLLGYKVLEITGETVVESLIIANRETNQPKSIALNGIFIYIGQKPNSSLFADQIELNQEGFIITNQLLETTMPGVYAVGDVRQTPLRQVITSAADGAIAAMEVAKHS